MNKYELVVLVKSQSSQEEREAIFKQATDMVSKCGGKITNSQVWLEKQRLTFTIKKVKEATFYLIKFESPANTIDKMKQLIRLNEDVLRFVFIKVE